MIRFIILINSHNIHTLSISFLFYFFIFLQCPHLYICIVCMYIWLNCIYLYLNVYCQCLMLTVCTKGLRVTQFQFSVCMYGTCGRIDNKADLTWQCLKTISFTCALVFTVFHKLNRNSMFNWHLTHAECKTWCNDNLHFWHTMAPVSVWKQERALVQKEIQKRQQKHVTETKRPIRAQDLSLVSRKWKMHRSHARLQSLSA